MPFDWNKSQRIVQDDPTNPALPPMKPFRMAMEEKPDMAAKVYNEGLVRPAKSLAKGAVESGQGLMHMAGNAADLMAKVPIPAFQTAGTAAKVVAKASEKSLAPVAESLRNPGQPTPMEEVYYGVGRAPGDMAGIMAATAATGGNPVAGMAAHGALSRADQGLKEAAHGAAEGALMGGMMRWASTLPIGQRMAASGTAMAAPVAAAGGSLRETATAFATGAGMGIPGGRGGQGVVERHRRAGEMDRMVARQATDQAERAAAQADPVAGMGMRPLGPMDRPVLAPGMPGTSAEQAAAKPRMVPPAFNPLKPIERLIAEKRRAEVDDIATSVLAEETLRRENTPPPVNEIPPIPIKSAAESAEVLKRLPENPPTPAKPAPAFPITAQDLMARDVYGKRYFALNPDEAAFINHRLKTDKALKAQYEREAAETLKAEQAKQTAPSKTPAPVASPEPTPRTNGKGPVGEPAEAVGAAGKPISPQGETVTGPVDRLQAAADEASARLGNVGKGTSLDATQAIVDMATVGANEIRKGAQKFETFAERMSAKFGDAFVPVADKVFAESQRLLKDTTGAMPKGQDYTDRLIAKVLGKLEKNEPIDEVDRIIFDRIQRQHAAKEAMKRGPVGIMNALRLKSSAVEKLQAKLVDSTIPLTARIGELGATKSDLEIAPGEKASRSRLTPNQIMQELINRSLASDTEAGIRLKKSGLLDAFGRATDQWALQQYMIAKHAEDLALNHNRRTGLDSAENQAIINKYENAIAVPAHGDQPAMTYRQVQELATRTSNELTRMLEDNGLIGRGVTEYLAAKYPHYTPFLRVLEMVDDHGPSSVTDRNAVAHLSKQTIIHNLRGSDKPIENPMESLLDRFYKVTNQINRNRAARFGIETLAKDEATAHLMREITKKDIKAGKRIDPNRTVAYLDNGVKRIFETTPEIAAAMKGLEIPQIEGMARMFNAMTRLAKEGFTGLNPRFFVKNPVRDTQTVMIQAPGAKGVKMTIDPQANVEAMKAAFASFQGLNDNALWEMMARHGAAFTVMDVGRMAAREAVKVETPAERGSIKGQAKGTVRKTVRSLAKAFRVMENAFGSTEMFNRAKIFDYTRREYMKRGYTEAEAEIAAAVETTTVLPNYMRAGSSIRKLNPFIPYLGARMAGARSMVNSYQRDPVGFVGRLSFGVLFPTVVATAMNLLSGDDVKRAYNDLRDHIKDNNFVVFYGDKPEKDGEGVYSNSYMIPMPQGLGEYARPIRLLTEKLVEERPKEMKAWLELMLGTGAEIGRAGLASLSPIDVQTDDPSIWKNAGSSVSGLVPQVLKPGLQATANYDFYRNQPVVPQSLQDRPARFQFTGQEHESTKALAKAVPDNLAFSPKKMEAFARDTAGVIGALPFIAGDLGLALAGKIPWDKVKLGHDANIEGIFTGARGGKGRDASYSARKELMDHFMGRELDRVMQSQAWNSGDREVKRKLENAAENRARSTIRQLEDSPGWDGAPDEMKVRIYQRVLKNLKGAK